MAIIVQKYGGTSVASVERIQAVAQRIYKSAIQGNSLLIVLSAMGKTTDKLIKLANDISKNPNRREMDMLLSSGEQVAIALLSMALQEIGQPAISMIAAQAGIITEAKHNSARILRIKTDRLLRHINERKVVLVAGFQGISSDEDMEITTLGRGGSDTSAVALAAALGADYCEINTDVPGIFTADPRLVPEAQLMTEITSDEMLELASLGAKVLHPRAVEIAHNHGVPLVVRSSWTDERGTLVTTSKTRKRALVNLELTRPVDDVQLEIGQTKIAFSHIPDKPGMAAQLFKEIYQQNVNVDLIIQSINEGNRNDIAFTVATSSLKQAETVTAAINPSLINFPNSEKAEVMIEQNIAKVSIVGAGMIGRSGVAAKMFTTLAEAGINIQMISTSEVKISCVVNDTEGEKASLALRTAFELEERKQANNFAFLPSCSSASPPFPPILGVTLDMNQARLAICQVPDQPGVAARLFGLLARHNISVDMIVQSQRCRVVDGIPRRDIAFTLPQIDGENAQQRLSQVAEKLGWGEVFLDSMIAKVSIVGAVAVKKLGASAKMFTALAEHQINIQMIAASEVKVSCVVAKEEGVKALQVIHTAFNFFKG